jgi:phosphatidylinositol alpha-1,6-mannosyltransferase
MSLRALLLTELYPPALGGSAELFANIYERFTRTPVTVWTDRTPNWGLLRPASLLAHFRIAARVRRLASRERLVVHCGRALPEGLHAYLAAIGRRIPYVCWTHGEELAIVDRSRELRGLLARVHARSHRIIANSRNTAAMLEARGVSADRIEVIHPGVDAERFRPDVSGAAALRARLAAPAEHVLLTVGRLQQRKGHDLVLRALAGLSSAPVRYIIAGDGEERERLSRLAHELGVADRVTFTGPVDSAELPALYAAADLFVHPNRIVDGDFEGFGIVFLEAAASGLAVIGGNSGGVPEALEAGVTGQLVSGDDPAELRGAIETLLASPSARREMGDAGRRRVLGHFSWQRAAERTEALHERVAAG